MIEISPELTVIILFGGIILGIILGYPLGVVLGGVGLIVGLLLFGEPILSIFRLRIIGFLSNWTLLAIPLFIYMGVAVERSGTAEKLYEGFYLWFGGMRGGLAIASVLMGTILAATVGIIAASVIMIGLIAAPSMIQRRYNRELISGSICAGGTLGILIPPSVMLVIYGPMAGISVGKLFMAALVPGLILSGLYILYIAIICWIRPELAPSVSAEERAVPLVKKLYILLTSVLPPMFLILAVLGSIFFGIAAPTEAGAIGCVAATLLALAYRRLSWQTLKGILLYTLRINSMVFIIAVGSAIFTGVFLRAGGGNVINELVLSAPGGKWGAFISIMFIIFILGMFIDYIGILFIIIPLATSIGEALGFNALWFALMICVNLQMSFMTPPFAFAIFYFKGISKPEWGITTGHIIRGVIPFIILIMVGLGLFVVFPQLILWLPSVMIR